MNRFYFIIVLSSLAIYYGCSAGNSTLNTDFENAVDSLGMRPARLVVLSYLFKKSYGSWPNSLQECYYLWGDSIPSLLAGEDTSYIMTEFTPLSKDTLKIEFLMTPLEIGSATFGSTGGTLYVVPSDSLRVLVKNVDVGWVNGSLFITSGNKSHVKFNGWMSFPLGPLDSLRVKCFKRGASG